LLGVAWFLGLAASGRFGWYLAGTVAGLWLSVGVCGAAERILREKDPGTVVLDEVAAVPLGYLTWAVDTWLATGRCGWAELFAQDGAWLLLAVGFVAFRLFDVVKPWPISAAQRLPGGWGVVLDDLLAALCTAGVLLLLSRSR
jgi:phosphatidylglycerophosphatase A